ncbi:MAG TPA: LacI family DNA-binding transcriptional regulator [Terriglobia bacterium]|nr:LacI family DNA-binding transcriptional regulator [Terriglobia bacterium]
MPKRTGSWSLGERSRVDESASRGGVTRNDVAAVARVSPSTVSYVINNGPRGVSVTARERVIKAIAKLGYHPSDVARSLRTRKTLTIGLVIPEITNPFYGEMVQAVEEVSYQHGYTVILGHSSHLPDRELRYSQVLRSKQVDGVIFLPVTPDLEPVESLRRAGIQVVILERIVPGYPCIVADEHNGGYVATRHLLGLGHRRIGCIVLAGDSTSSVARVEGYRRALREAGVSPRKNWVVESEYGYGAGESAAWRFLKRPGRPTAVVAHNDLMAIGAMKTFMEAGFKVPASISLVGFDDIAAASYVQPPLTTIAYPKRQMGRTAIETLLRLLESKDPSFTETLKLPIRLVVRGSTGPPP